MLHFPSFVSRRGKSLKITWLIEAFFILTTVINVNQAGVIKKRDTIISEASGSIQETEVLPTVLTALNNTSAIVTTKLQSVVANNFATETSKELTNNEILLNEAKKLLEEEDKIINSNNETELKQKTEIENDNENKTPTGKQNELRKNVEDIPQKVITVDPKSQDNLQDIKQIILNLENKEQISTESNQNISTVHSNIIKFDQINKDMDEDEKLSMESEERKTSEHFSSFENSLKSHDENSHSIRTETDSPLVKPREEFASKQLETHDENTIETNREKVRDPLQFKSMEKISNLATDISMTPNPIKHVFENQPFNISIPSIVSDLKREIETTAASTSSESSEPFNQQKHSNKIPDGVDRNIPVKSNRMKLSPQSAIESTIEDERETTSQSSKEEDLLIFEGNKNEFNRSINLNSDNIDDVSISITTIKPVILSVKEGIEEATHQTITEPEMDKLKKPDIEERIKEEVLNQTDVNETNPENLQKQQEEQFTKVVAAKVVNQQSGIDMNKENIYMSLTPVHKEKKPKFISDNSTNAQQLNLPNNAEVWSLAAMKFLPKANDTMETAPTHNQTLKQFKENILQQNATLTTNNNSEKNLLDWSQIMMDREMSTTTRNDEIPHDQQPRKEENHLSINEDHKENDPNHLQSLEVTTNAALANEHTTPPAKIEPKQDETVTINSLLESEQMRTVVAPTTAAAILSETNNNNEDNNDETDKKNERMNNHIQTLTETLVTTMKSSAPSTTVTTGNMDGNPNPSNTSLNAEQNLNEINLTSNQTEATTYNDVHTTERKQTAATMIMMTTTTPPMTLASTESTAVHDMTTVEQNTNGTTTVSTLQTINETASINNVAALSEYKNNNSVITEKIYTSTLPPPNTLENIYKQIDNNNNNNINNFENVELQTTTTTVVPVTTFRPHILPIITSTSAIPALFEQEVDQNGNEIQINLKNTNGQQQQQQQQEQQQEHFVAPRFETTTPVTTPRTAIPELAAVDSTDNTPTSFLENNTTSSSKDKKLDEATELKLDINETTSATVTATTTQTTPKQLYNNKIDETTISSTVSVDEKLMKTIETETETETILTTAIANATVTSKPPVVVFDAQGGTLNENSTIIITTTTSSDTTEGNIIETTTRVGTEYKENESTTLRTAFKKEDDAKIETTTDLSTTMAAMTTTTTTTVTATSTADDETYISLLDDTTTTTTTSTTQTYSPTTSATTPSPSSSEPSLITTKIEDIYNVIHSTTTEFIQTTTTQLITESEESSTSPSTLTSTSTSSSFPYSTVTEMIPSVSSTPSTKTSATADIGKSLPTLTSILGGNSGNMYPKNSDSSGETDVNVIIAITVSVIGVIALILLVGFLYLMRKRQKQTSYSQRCRPVSLDEYTIDNGSIGGSTRKSSGFRSSKRTYGNLAFDDPSIRHNPMGVHELAKFAQEKLRIFEEFRDVPQITSKLDEVPLGCEDKNRYANVLPLPETRVILQRLNDDEKTEYINANYVTGPKDAPNYYIACQAPLDTTVEDFWRMIWEQQSRVIIQATDLIENGVEKCAEYLPPSVTLDNHSSFGDFQITLQNREIKDKYAISTLLLKNVSENATRELTHYWYKWPEVGVPTEEAPIIAMLLEARSSLISYAIEQANEDKEKSSSATLKSAEEGVVPSNGPTTLQANNSNGSSANGSTGEINGNISMVHIKKTARNQGPLTIHCSPGTGRTGTIIACDIALRSLETPKRTVDIPQIVYYVRRGRASAVLTKEQYEFIYKVANMYAAKISNPTNYN